MMQKQISSVR